MRLLVLAPRWSDRGGADHYLRGLLEGLAPKHEVMLVVGRADPALSAPCALSICRGLDASGLDGSASDLDALARIADRFGPDRIWAHNLVDPQALGWIADRRGLLTIQDHRFFCPGRGKWTAAGRVCQEPMGPRRCAACLEDLSYFRAVFELTRRRLEAAARMRLGVLSDYMRRELLAAGLDPDRIHVTPAWVHGLPPAHQPPGPGCVLFVGRLVAAKGVEDAVRVWRRSELDLPLVLAGTGSQRAVLQAQGLDVRGWLDRARLADLYAAARAVLMPSRWQEPFGIVGLEALSRRVPVAAWASGGVAEWLSDRAPIAWGDRAALAERLRSLVGQRAETAQGFGEQAGLAAAKRLLESDD